MDSKDNIIRADWKDNFTVKFFLDLCIEQVNTLGKNGSSLKKESWNKIIQEFDEKNGLKFTHKQLKNQWNYLRQKYVVWTNLVGKSGHGYDSVTNTVRWGQEEWADYLQKVPEAKQFRHVGLKYTDEMRALFDGSIATGKEAWGPTRDEQSIESSMPTQEGAMEEPIENAISSSTRKDNSLRPEKRHKKNRSEDIDLQIMTVLKTLEKSEGPSIQECNDKLSGMTMINESDIEYLVACSIFCESSSYREQWLALCEKSEELRIGWIRMVGRKLGFL